MLSGVLETVRYTYRLRPGRQAEAALLAEWGKCRFLWNEAVHQWKARRKPTTGKLSKLLTDSRAKHAWLRAGSQVAQQQTLRTYMAALDASFKVKGRGRPRPKKAKTALPSLEYTTRGFRIKDGRLCLPRGIAIPVVWSRDLPAQRAKLQRRMARRRRPNGAAPSKGYLIAKRQSAKVEKKAARQNTHDANQWAARVAASHRLIAVEDFKPKFLAKTRAGRIVVLVPPAYTTMTCAECGTRTKERLGLGVRVFECTACGQTADRDLNAARTILATAERNRASADDVRHSIASFRDGGSGAVRAGNPPDSSVGSR